MMVAAEGDTGAWEFFTSLSISEMIDLLKATFHGIDLLFNCSGAIVPMLKIPQVSLAMSPWAYVPEAWNGAVDRIKARLQRSGYRRAYRRAAKIFYLSGHLRELYRCPLHKIIFLPVIPFPHSP